MRLMMIARARALLHHLLVFRGHGDGSGEYQILNEFREYD